MAWVSVWPSSSSAEDLEQNKKVFASCVKIFFLQESKFHAWYHIFCFCSVTTEMQTKIHKTGIFKKWFKRTCVLKVAQTLDRELWDTQLVVAWILTNMAMPCKALKNIYCISIVVFLEHLMNERYQLVEANAYKNKKDKSVSKNKEKPSMPDGVSSSGENHRRGLFSCCYLSFLGQWQDTTRGQPQRSCLGVLALKHVQIGPEVSPSEWRKHNIQYRGC